MSFLIRSQPAEYGWELNEFDPFFNFRATQYIVENGIVSYFEWHDDLSWYPDGRAVSKTSQSMLHITTAVTYSIFGGGLELYDFTILFPAIVGSLTTIVIFALVRVIGGTTAGLLSAMFFSVSLPIIVRGPIGWFKSEPLGLFFSLIGVYFLLSGINSKDKSAFLRLIGAGAFTIFGLSAWGGNQFFILVIGFFIITLPFLRKDHKFLLWAIPVFSISTILFSFSEERLSFNYAFIRGLGGVSLIVPTILMVATIFIQNKSAKNKSRNSLLFIFAIIIIGSSFLILNAENQILPIASHRYLNAVNPFLTTTDPLVDSVSEHATTTIQQSFLFNSILMIFAGIGIWILIQNFQKNSERFIKSEMLVFSLILGIFGVYLSSTFIRLELFASIPVIIFSSLGLSFLLRNFYNSSTKQKNSFTKITKFSFGAGIIFLLLVPLIYPPNSDVFSLTDTPPTILNGGTAYTIATNDWLDTLSWIKNNTPSNSVFASWWDYGYWISTMGERATLADNATLSTLVIQNIAKMLLSEPDEGHKMLLDMDADYVLVFVAFNKLSIQAETEFFTLSGGGDESKKQWFMRIAGLDESQFLHSDGLSGTDHFWNNTLLGQMFPFSLLGYLNPNNIQHQSETYVPGMVGIYQKDIKLTENENGPLKFVYASPSFYDGSTGPKIGVFIYEINKNYLPDS